MKKLWKALGITALAAAVIPYRFRKDEDAGISSMDALLWQATRHPGEGDDKDQLDISIGFKSPLQTKREESSLFADDEPEAAIVDAPLTEAVEEAVDAAIEEVIAGAEDDKAGFDPEV